MSPLKILFIGFLMLLLTIMVVWLIMGISIMGNVFYMLFDVVVNRNSVVDHGY